MEGHLDGQWTPNIVKQHKMQTVWKSLITVYSVDITPWDVDRVNWMLTWGQHPTVSSVDIMAVMSTRSTETWCQAAGGLCRKFSVSGRHHGRDVDQVHSISVCLKDPGLSYFLHTHVCPVDRDRVQSTEYTVCTHLQKNNRYLVFHQFQCARSTELEACRPGTCRKLNFQNSRFSPSQSIFHSIRLKSLPYIIYI